MAGSAMRGGVPDRFGGVRGHRLLGAADGEWAIEDVAKRGRKGIVVVSLGEVVANTLVTERALGW